MKEKIWISLHNICGDCSRRTKMVLDLEKNSLKDVIRIVKMYYPKYNMACSRCSANR